jgi:allantoinase
VSDLPPTTFVLRSNRVVTTKGVRAANILVDDGLIRGVYLPDAELDESLADISVEDVGSLVISPGVIDAHVHVNDPGTDWEGFDTATKAAAAGGVTTIVDMPLNSIPVTTHVDAFAKKRIAAVGNCWVDVGFYGGLVQGNADQMKPLCDAGVLGVKAFLCHSGLEEFPNALEADLRMAMPLLAAARVPLLVHAELLNSPAPAVTDVRSFAQFVASRPVQWELDAIRLMIDLCRETRCQVHIVHLATGAALPMLAAAKAVGLPITVETCPHYLFFENTKVADGDTRFKCAPPIREGAANELWQGLLAGTIDTIGSDHSPCPPAMKHLDTGDFSQAWGGIASLQLTLPTTWSFMKSKGCEDFSLLATWLSLAPASLVGLDQRKGQITPGFDADFVIWDPESRWTIKAADLLHRHPITPYDGCEVTGKVLRTYVRGQQVYREGHVLGRPQGVFMMRNSEGKPTFGR